MKITRNEFLKSMAVASIAVKGAGTAASLSEDAAQPLNKKNHNLKLGVSVYSYMRDFHAGTATVESCLADIADIGAEYVEIVAQAHISGYPNPTDEWVDQFLSWLDKYQLKQSAYDTYTFDEFFQDRFPTMEEVLDLLRADLKCANKLGFPWVRGFVPTFPEDAPSDVRNNDLELKRFVRTRFEEIHPSSRKFLESAIAMAEEYNTKLVIELHSPVLLDSPWVNGIIDVIEEKKTEFLGLNLDYSCMLTRPSRVTVDMMVEQGAKREIVEYIISAYQERLGPEKTIEEVIKMGGGKIEQEYASDKVMGIYHSSYSDPKLIRNIAPYIIYSHAKFHEITEDLTEYSIPYPAILQEYINNNIEGVLSSEYEGMDNASTAIRMQHAMIRNILGMGHRV